MIIKASKNKNNIVCHVACEYTNGNKLTRGFELTVKGKVWPCCYYATAQDYPLHEPGIDQSDPVLDKLIADDPDWNNAVIHGFDKVTQHPIFWNYLWDEGFDSDTPPAMCLRQCQEEPTNGDEE